MRRREFIKVLGGGAAAWPLASRAQQESVPVVGVLSGQSQESEAALLAEWRKALNDTGYVGGRNVLFEYRFADGEGDRLPMLAADLVEVPNRQDKSSETAKKFGVERKQVWMTFGPYDFVHLYEAPNDEAMAKFVMTLGLFGNIRTIVMRAWGESEYLPIIRA